MNTILIAENNVDFSYALKWFLENKGYRVIVCEYGEKAIEAFDHIADISLVLLDINLDGEVSGSDVLQHIRKEDENIPIIMMSGENKSPSDVINGLEAGANIFLKKPLSLEEIEAYIKSALKKRSTEEKDKYAIGDITLYPLRRTLELRNEIEYLSDKECRVLQLLLSNSPQLVSLDTLLSTIWGDTRKEESLRNIISALRKKLKNSSIEISTVKLEGYLLQSRISS